jgi:CheY-like chemotaxis protein
MRVLVVEDEPLVAMLVEAFLEDLGCEIAGTAARLEDALEKARALMMDLAVLDVNLAGSMSYPVAKILKLRNVPFVFATGYGMAGLPKELHAAPVISKPFRQEQLGQALRLARSSR